MLASDAAVAWARSSTPGTCGVTEEGPSDCVRGEKGSWPLRGNQSSSWLLAAQHCLPLCRRCANCKFLSIGLWASDCSWYASCGTLRQNIGGFRSAPVLGAHRLEAAPWPAPQAPPLEARAALQVSGHPFERTASDLSRRLSRHLSAHLSPLLS